MNRLELGQAIMDLIAEAQGRPIDADQMAQRIGVDSSQVRRELRWLEDQGTLRPAPSVSPGSSTSSPSGSRADRGARRVRLFICHASVDVELAAALVDLFVTALRPPEGAIRCSSVSGYKLEGGASVDEQLRAEVHDADAFVGLISAAAVSGEHRYVLFELGARWGTRRHLVPLCAPGVDPRAIGAPINMLNALRIDRDDELHQLVVEIARTLWMEAQPPNVYLSALRRLAAQGASPLMP